MVTRETPLPSMEPGRSDGDLVRLLRYVAEATGLALGRFEGEAPQDELSPIARWARSGLMSLTGPAGGAPLLATRDYVGRLSSLCSLVRILARGMGGDINPQPELVAERAALAGLSRNGNVSPGGTARILRTMNGYVAVNLARPDDIEMLPAWIGCEATDSPWEALQQAASTTASETLVERAQLFGIPVSQWRATAEDCMPMHFTRMSRPARGKQDRTPLLVLDFSGLWAGPLCGHFFTQLGARVVKVESTRRPDAARSGPAAFFDLLHQGQEMLAVDFKCPFELARLRKLMMKADVVIEASRPRAFAQLGFDPAEIFHHNPGLAWISITAYGRDGPHSNRVGFGDDVAVAAGLVAFDAEGRPNFVGDALADPVAGLAATAGGLAALLAGGGVMVDTPMIAAASFVGAAPRVECGNATLCREGSTWKVSSDGVTGEVLAPCSRRPSSKAAELGAHTTAVLAEFG